MCVFVRLGGGNAEYVTAYEGHVMPMEDGMTFTDAAAIPEVWLTAYQLLHFVGTFSSFCFLLTLLVRSKQIRHKYDNK